MRKHNKKRGFALIIALGMMAFGVLLIVSMTTLSQVEVQASKSMQNLYQARQNAKLGLMIALGELQKTAGPDQAVTARAEYLDADLTTLPLAEGVVNPYWTGVWDTRGNNPDPKWLVSNNPSTAAPNPLNPIPGTAITLVGANTVGPGRPDLHVTAEAVEIKEEGIPGTTGEVITGRYAYWVGDEGVKASVALTDKTANAPAGWLSALMDQPAENRLGQIAPFTMGGTQVFLTDGGGNAVVNPNRQEVRDILDKVSTFQQLPLVSPAVDTGRLNANFHDATPRAQAVLASTVNNVGLKEDLSINPAAAELIAGPDLERYLKYDDPIDGYMLDPETDGDGTEGGLSNSLRRRYEITTSDYTQDNKVKFRIAPVITEAWVQFGVMSARDPEPPGSTTYPILAVVKFFVELWNPYTSALKPEDMSLEIHNLPVVDITFQGAIGTSPTNINFPALHGDPLLNGNPLKLPLNFMPNTTSGLDDESWLPGRIYCWTAPRNMDAGSREYYYNMPSGTPASFYDKQMDNSPWGAKSGVYPQGTPDPTFKLIYNRKLQLEFVLKDSQGSIIARAITPEFDEFETGRIPHHAQGNQMPVGYYLSLYEAEHDNANSWTRGK